MCFVFKYFLASFPLSFIFCSSLHSPIAGTLPLSLTPRHAPAPTCDNVSTNKTTIIGYHKSDRWSSGKCKKSVIQIVEVEVLLVALAEETKTPVLATFNKKDFRRRFPHLKLIP